MSRLPPFYVSPGIPSIELDENPIKIIVPFYNASAFIEKSMMSALTQKYNNFKVIFIDDASTDDSWDKLPHDNEKAICIRNEVNVTALPNIHKAIMEYCEPNDIIVLLDGDDWLPNNKVLQYIDEFYRQNDCWIMYGQASWSTGQKGFASVYTEEEFTHLRKTYFKVSHIRTFRAGLYHKIKEQDPDFSCMKDKNGEWYKMTYDVSIMFPIMEMAGYEKIKYNDKSLYIYNFENPISDHRVNQQLQWDIHKEISNKTPFKKIESYV
jgi:glycosyltransferase involved in cell wall biosynthesis